MKPLFGSGSRFTRPVIIQVAIGALLAVWIFVGLPRLRNEWAAEEVAKKEARIENVIHDLIVEDPAREAPPGSAEGYSHAQRLLRTPSVEEVKQTMGAADGFGGDFRGGVHLIWTGTHHKLEASFNNDQLYCLRVEDLSTGHGELVFESSLNWQSF